MSLRRLTISEGALGPIRPCTIEARPFTVLIGKQGTGKSLLSQILYFFDNLPYLVAYHNATLGAARGEAAEKVPDGRAILRTALDRLRSSDVPFSTFVDDAVTLTYHADEEPSSKPLGLTIAKVSGTFLGRPLRRARYRMNDALRAHVSRARLAPKPHHRALFVPAERVLFSQASAPSTWQLLSLPSTLRFFADMMDLARRTFSTWEGEVPDTAPGRWIAEIAEAALAGRPSHKNDVWRWRIPGKDTKKSFRMDMASSGQRANWPLVVLAQVLFSWRAGGEVTPPSTIYVEEPEIHLHPQAQVAMVKVLAFLVKHGFRVVVTTHSLTVLYALNNLVLASDLGDDPAEGVPEPKVRLSPDQVTAYALQPDGTVRDIADRETGFLSEVELGQVAADLGDEMNLIAMLRSARAAG